MTEERKKVIEVIKEIHKYENINKPVEYEKVTILIDYITNTIIKKIKLKILLMEKIEEIKSIINDRLG